ERSRYLSYSANQWKPVDETVEWSDLPKELWPIVGKSLDNRIDVVRFRSICKSWRCSIPLFHKDSPRFPLSIKPPSLLNRSHPLEPYLALSIVYRLEPTHDSQSPSTSSSRGWLMKVEETKSGQLRLLNPISNRRDRYPSDNFPNVLNLMEFGVVELAKAYSFKSVGRLSVSGISKVVLYPNSAWTDVSECIAFAIYDEGKLGFLKVGNEEWKLVDDKNFYYDDIIVYKGHFYVVDNCGTISWIDSSFLKLIQFSPPLCGFGNKKYLVESCGSLYVVDMYFEPRRRGRIRGRGFLLRQLDEVVHMIKVYKLDEEWGTWVDIKNMGDRVFILAKDCNFSVSAQEFTGFQGNCIYFFDQCDIRVFNLEDSRLGTLAYFPACSKVFWPSPSLQLGST
ncbi:F-box protein, partial [Quillaja saponaria]